MKKKFVLTLALVLMVAGTLVAATPIEVSGDFYAGYTVDFTNKTVADDGSNAVEGEIYNVSFTGDFFKVTFDELNFDDAQSSPATAYMYLDKALAAQGIDMGDVTVTLSIGNMSTLKPADVYTDSNDAVAELEMASTYPSKITLGYADMVTVEFAADPTDTANKPILVGAKLMPIDGVSVAVGYTNTTASTAATKGGITGSATVDVAALTGLDFGLTVSALDVYDFADEDNKLYAEVNASYSDFGAWVEYQNISSTSNVIAEVSYSGIESVGMYAGVELADLSDITTTISAGVDYTLGGVTYALDGAYEIDGAFTLTPSVAISF